MAAAKEVGANEQIVNVGEDEEEERGGRRNTRRNIKLGGRLRRYWAQARPNQGQTKEIARTSQAKPGRNQAKKDSEDVSGETGPKPGQTRAKPGRF